MMIRWKKSHSGGDLLLLLIASLAAVCTAAEHEHRTHMCSTEGNICSENAATVCRNNTCVSACSLRGMQECECDAEEDNYCYLCCGNSEHQCMAAHHHNILRPNGERWEREACSRCRMHGAELEGLPCDDTDSARLCIGGRCSNSVCHTKSSGSVCDRKMEKLCVDNTCENPCARYAPHLMVCDCPSIDQDTGFASEDRCQLCCYDFNLKPTNRRCQNAYRKYKIMDMFQKPIWRVGLECAGGKVCNKYGVCSSSHISFLIPYFFVILVSLISLC
ncbi:hypothetical protein CAEBREN_20619 [Caenorhabditis brenneri]|uniref:Uncharacterized protein n=1 Tax=Caenorhabditis brenneri TaxID=135651 RepID=G0MH25_CAEBE|nr:hypothetical protein CAEBREN_20619 [Caenorhabditis brenneri]